MADALSPSVRDGRLFGHASREEEQELLATIGLDGSFPAAEADFLSVTGTNQGPNKIDAYLERSISYSPTFRPDTGIVEGTVEIRLTNSAPPDGLPVEVIGNRHDRPPGTNQMLLTVYSALQVREARLNGQPVGFGATTRFGRSASVLAVDVPPESTVTVELDLRGTLERSRIYTLVVGRQPTVNPDVYEIELAGTGGWEVVQSGDLAVDGGRGRVTLEEGRSVAVSARFAED